MHGVYFASATCAKASVRSEGRTGSDQQQLRCSRVRVEHGITAQPDAAARESGYRESSPGHPVTRAPCPQLDGDADKQRSVLEVALPCRRLVYSPPGRLVRDYHDVRSVSEAAHSGVKRALEAGAKSPLLVLPDHEWFPSSRLASLLGALSALYVPLQLREDVPAKSQKVSRIGVWSPGARSAEDIVRIASVLEQGRTVARDIGTADPERMCPANVQRYVEDVFRDTAVGVEMVSDPGVLAREYPLFSAVDRAARGVERYKGRVLYLTYEPEGPVGRTLLLVGKGVTYDTGGADVKTGGGMVGMSRDKCGAAAVAGFMKVVSLLKPEGVKVVGALPLVRNSVGVEGYVADEILTARSGARVRVVNTDAEGRMILADALCRMKELAVEAVNPHLMTIATLTGHAIRAVGRGYTIAMDNGPAKAERTVQRLQEAGEALGDMFEISTIRREDFSNYKGKGEGVDVMQTNTQSSSKQSRGHQGPGAFLIMASGLDKHGLDSEKPLRYTHLDIAPSAGDLPDQGTGCPLLALYAFFIGK
ncbi:putative aminopeptidase W07G4.4 isoform X2 [Bacillus rossius redtenbacheri]|uniref:putative aminopeptidase W07G4.4 isoform X2 n=1 Tax=Bacillus rossius redtenbacheri TaxID=93214 RepID=UPI002FDDD180